MTTTPTPRERALAMLALGPVTLEHVSLEDGLHQSQVFMALSRLTKEKHARVRFVGGAYRLSVVGCDGTVR